MERERYELRIAVKQMASGKCRSQAHREEDDGQCEEESEPESFGNPKQELCKGQDGHIETDIHLMYRQAVHDVALLVAKGFVLSTSGIGDDE